MLAVRLRCQDYIRFHLVRFAAVSSADIYAVWKVVLFQLKCGWTGAGQGLEEMNGYVCLHWLLLPLQSFPAPSFFSTIFRCFVSIPICLAVCCWFWIVIHFFDPYLVNTMWIFISHAIWIEVVWSQKALLGYSKLCKGKTVIVLSAPGYNRS